MSAAAPQTEAGALMDDGARERAVKSVIEGVHRDTDADLVFDTNRNWTTKMSVLARLFPDFRMVAMVRPMAWVFDSIERKHRESPCSVSGIFPPNALTARERAAAMVRTDGFAGGPSQALRDACFGPEGHRILVVDYQALAKEPGTVLNVIYRHVGAVAWHGHDFSHVYFDADTFDARLGLDGLHRVQGDVRPPDRSLSLPPDLAEALARHDWWQHDVGNAVIIRDPSALS